MKKHKLYIFLTIIFTFILFALGISIRYIIDPVGLNNKFDLGLNDEMAEETFSVFDHPVIRIFKKIK